MKLSDRRTRSIVSDLSQSPPAGPLLPLREAWEATGALPVYADAGGTLLVSTDGDVLFYRSDSRAFDRVTSSRWRRIAIVRAAERYVALAELCPRRPRDAPDCSACEGRGSIHHPAPCAECGGLGWIWLDFE